MAKNKSKRSNDSEFTLFDVVYEDGAIRSNRRVPTTALGGLDGDEPAKTIIEQQDRDIAAQSGQPPRIIKTIKRSGK